MFKGVLKSILHKNHSVFRYFVNIAHQKFGVGASLFLNFGKKAVRDHVGREHDFELAQVPELRVFASLHFLGLGSCGSQIFSCSRSRRAEAESSGVVQVLVRRWKEARDALDCAHKLSVSRYGAEHRAR